MDQDWFEKKFAAQQKRNKKRKKTFSCVWLQNDE
jgi:hypothetical protein